MDSNEEPITMPALTLLEKLSEEPDERCFAIQLKIFAVFVATKLEENGIGVNPLELADFAVGIANQHIERKNDET